MDGITYRPVAGQINFNTNFLSFQDTHFEEQLESTLHEITHILGFSSALFEYYTYGFGSTKLRGVENIVQKVFLRSKDRNVITTPKIMETTRKYFGCPAVAGAELEDYESNSTVVRSHFERTIFNNEIMTGNAVKERSYSEFSLSLLEDTGWYQVNYSRAEPLYFGKGAGCSFLNDSCSNESLSNRREWCKNLNTSLCSFNYRHQALCTVDGLSDNCSYAYPFANGDCENFKNRPYPNLAGEIYSPGSKCFMSTLL